MSNFKRKKCRRSIRCTLCTPNRWKGNRKDRRPAKEPKKDLISLLAETQNQKVPLADPMLRVKKYG